MISELAGDDVGQQAGARLPALDRLGQPRGDHHVRGAGPAGELGAHVLDDHEASGSLASFVALNQPGQIAWTNFDAWSSSCHAARKIPCDLSPTTRSPC